MWTYWKLVLCHAWEVVWGIRHAALHKLVTGISNRILQCCPQQKLLLVLDQYFTAISWWLKCTRWTWSYTLNIYYPEDPFHINCSQDLPTKAIRRTKMRKNQEKFTFYKSLPHPLPNQKCICRYGVYGARDYSVMIHHDPSSCIMF